MGYKKAVFCYIGILLQGSLLKFPQGLQLLRVTPGAHLRDSKFLHITKRQSVLNFPQGLQLLRVTPGAHLRDIEFLVPCQIKL